MTSLNDQVGKSLDRLQQGLRPYVEERLRHVFADRWEDEVRKTLRRPPQRVRGELHLDSYVLLAVMWYRWNDAFRGVLGQSERSLVSELHAARNRWAHQEGFTTDDAFRAADSVVRLLKAVGADNPLIEAHQVKRDLLRRYFEEEYGISLVEQPSARPIHDANVNATAENTQPLARVPCVNAADLGSAEPIAGEGDSSLEADNAGDGLAPDESGDAEGAWEGGDSPNNKEGEHDEGELNEDDDEVEWENQYHEEDEDEDWEDTDEYEDDDEGDDEEDAAVNGPPSMSDGVSFTFQRVYDCSNTVRYDCPRHSSPMLDRHDFRFYIPRSVFPDRRGPDALVVTLQSASAETAYILKLIGIPFRVCSLAKAMVHSVRYDLPDDARTESLYVPNEVFGDTPPPGSLVVAFEFPKLQAGTMQAL
jgi:hypothetical protein